MRSRTRPGRGSPVNKIINTIHSLNRRQKCRSDARESKEEGAKRTKIQYDLLAHGANLDRIPPAAESQSGTLVDRLELDPALAPQRDAQERDSQEMVVISQARVVVVGDGMMDVEVEVLEDRRRAMVIESEPAYGPSNERLRA